jgi:hypothetical protein
MERDERKRRQLLDGFKDKRIYCNLKEQTLDLPLWRTGFSIYYGTPVKW